MSDFRAKKKKNTKIGYACYATAITQQALCQPLTNEHIHVPEFLPPPQQKPMGLRFRWLKRMVVLFSQLAPSRRFGK